MTTLAQDIIGQLKEMLQMDFASTPAFMFISRLKDELQSRGFDVPTSEELATSLDVEISPGQVSPEEIGELAQLYAELIEKSWENFRANGFANPTQAMLIIIKKMTLKFS